MKYLTKFCPRSRTSDYRGPCLASQGRILSHISFVFLAVEFQEKLFLRFTDLYDFLLINHKLKNLHFSKNTYSEDNQLFCFYTYDVIATCNMHKITHKRSVFLWQHVCPIQLKLQSHYTHYHGNMHRKTTSLTVHTCVKITFFKNAYPTCHRFLLHPHILPPLFGLNVPCPMVLVQEI